ncbi:radical SAM protein [Candidatus Gottesmanbacteria bacterium]|nr:radical SAM protein [Candidatus Gottesmanbacteria bacterium]
MQKIQVKSILVPSKLPEADYVINAYVGCAFGCSYCYASFMGRFVDKTVADWGNYVFAKINLPEVLDADLRKTKDKTKSVFLSSVTDPYQGAEQKYQLTRKALELLLKYRWQGTVGILTKSPLVTRDIDLFKQFPNVEVGLTVTSTDDDVSRFLERAAPPASIRLATLKKLHDAGVKTYAFVGPLLPHFSATPEKLKDIFDALADAGVEELFIEHINLSPYIKKRLVQKLKGVAPAIMKKFYSSQSKDYREELNQTIRDLLPHYSFRLRMSQVIYHQDVHKKV